MHAKAANKMRRLLAALLAFPGASDAISPIQRVVSGIDGMRLAPQPAIPWQSFLDDETVTGVVVSVNTTLRLQAMRGFGASATESSAMCLNSLPADAQDKLLDDLFSEAGAHLSAMKAPMDADDESASAPWSTYDDSPGDDTLSNFSIARDLRQNGTLQFLLRAQQHGFEGVVQSYMDFPPDWMLAGHSNRTHGTVNRELYDVLANYYAKYVQSYAEHNVTIDLLSLFNEPTGYTEIYPTAIAELLGHHVGPLFDKLGLHESTKLTYGGAVDRSNSAWMTPLVMANDAARMYMDHIAFHAYDCNFNCTKEQQHYGLVADMKGLWPELDIWMTETCYAYEAGYPTDPSAAPPLPRLDFADGRTWGSRLVADVHAGVSGWIYWNVILDMRGGPFLISPDHGNPDGNWQHAVVHVDASQGVYHLTGLYYYLAHFSKFVRPGAVHVESTVLDDGSNNNNNHDDDARRRGDESHDGNPAAPEGTEGVEAAAFLDGDKKTVVLQLLNHDLVPRNVTVRCGGHEATLLLPSGSITTATWVSDGDN